MRWVHSLSITARRTAGRLGLRGGPGRRYDLFPPLRPAMLGQAQVLQEGIGNARHQRVPVQPCPGAPLEVAQTELSLELLMGLLADPACLDRTHQPMQRRTRWQVGEIVLALA